MNQPLADAYKLLKTGTLWLSSGKCKGFATANPGEAAKIDVYVAALVAGQQPTAPALATATGRGIVGMLAALAPAPAPPPPAATESPDNTVVKDTLGKIVDANGHVWRISATGKVLVDGVADAVTSGVVELAYEAKKIWQKNSGGSWWYKLKPTDSWLPVGGTTASPVPGDTPPPAPSSYPRQGACAPLGAIRGKDLSAYMQTVVALGNGHPMALRTDWWPGNTDFDKVRAAAEAHGIKVLPILNYDPGNRPSIASFAAQAALLANLGVSHINLLNEPNLGGWTPQDAAAYVRAAYDAIKADKPGCIVVAPDVAANAGAGKTPQSCVDWLTVYKAAGAKQDVLALNLYNDAEQLDVNWNLWSKVSAIKAIFPGLPVWSLEGGCKVLSGVGGSQLSYGTKWGTLSGSAYQEKCVSTALAALAAGTIDVYHVYSLYDDASPGGFGLYPAPGLAARPAVATFEAKAT